MSKIKYLLFLCTVLLLLTGCSPKDDFDDNEFVEYPSVENVSARTEFDEYEGDAESITVFITNGSDKGFPLRDGFLLQKKADDNWRSIKVYPKPQISTGVNVELPEHSEASVDVDLKEYVKLPLLSGEYRVWVGGMNSDKMVSAEFTIK